MKTVTLSVDSKGWTEWLSKKAMNRLVCCDCGLSHDIEIGIKTTTTLRGNINRMAVIRLKRNMRSTAQHRKNNIKNFFKELRGKK